MLGGYNILNAKVTIGTCVINKCKHPPIKGDFYKQYGAMDCHEVSGSIKCVLSCANDRVINGVWNTTSIECDIQNGTWNTDNRYSCLNPGN